MKYARIIYIAATLIALIIIMMNIPSVMGREVVPQSREQIRLSYAPLVKKVAPAVVNIYTSRTIQRRTNPFMNDPFFSQFFGQGMLGGMTKQRVQNSLGSGVIISSEGLVVTNAHVIKGAEEIVVMMNDGREYKATIALVDKLTDVALLRIDEKGLTLPSVHIRSSETMEVGDLVLAIGNPFGVGQTVTSGIVSALSRPAQGVSDFNFFIQTDAAINPGNSGGPLVAMDGSVVGINTAIYSRSGGSQGIGFAIPAEIVLNVTAAEKNGRKASDGVLRAWLGAHAQDVTQDIADSVGLDRPQGAMIVDVSPHGPSNHAGLRSGDVVLSVNGKSVKDATELRYRYAMLSLGQKATLDVFRSGKKKTLSIRAEAPPEIPPRDTTLLKGTSPISGATVVNVSPAVVAEMRLIGQESGVVVTDVPRGSLASRFGFARGTGIIAINGQKITSVKQLKKLVEQTASRTWQMTLMKDGRTSSLMLRY